MILTLTPNPSLDLLFGADRLVWDDANRVPMPRRRPGGQGINLVRAVRVLDPEAPAMAIAPMGGAVGAELSNLLREEGTPLRVVELEAETRVFVAVREHATARSLLLNPRGPQADDGLGAHLEQVVREEIGHPGAAGAGGVGPAVGGARVGARPWVACCGSLLPGLPDDFYGRIGGIAHELGARFVPDCDGEALARSAPLADLLVPNAHELGRLVGGSIAGPAEAAQAAEALLTRSGSEAEGDHGTAGEAMRIVVTLGAEGAVAVGAASPGSRAGGVGRGGRHRRAWWARPVLDQSLEGEAQEGSAVGAGDAFLASLLLHYDDGPLEQVLAGAVAAGTAALMSRSGDLIRRKDVLRVGRRVEVEALW